MKMSCVFKVDQCIADSSILLIAVIILFLFVGFLTVI